MSKKKDSGELDKEARIKKHNKSKGHEKDHEYHSNGLKHKHKDEKRPQNHAVDHYLRNGHLYLDNDEDDE